MGKVYTVVLLGSIISIIGTMIGASLGVLIKNPTKKLLGFIIGFAGGLMLAVVVFDLIPDAINNWSFSGTLICSIIGIGIIMCVDNLWEERKTNTSGLEKSSLKVSFMVAVGLMMHNFPEGIIMGCSFFASAALGIKMCIIIAVHDIPEGIAVVAPLMATNTKKSRILLYSFLTALPTAVGVWIGAWIGNISKDILGICLSLASGIMLYVICGEMFPQSSKLWEGITTTTGILIGIILGLIMINVI